MSTPPVGLPRARSVRPSILPPVAGIFVLCILASWVTTQWLASSFAYQNALGAPLVGRVYAPWSWLVWSHKFYDNAQPQFDRAYLVLAIAFGAIFAGGAVVMALRNRRTSAIKDLHGSARWATEEEIRATGLMPRKTLTGEAAGAGVYIGAWKSPKGRTYYLRHNGPEHILAFAPTRSGKGIGLVLPTLLSWPESAVVFDLKGEGHALTAGWRKSQGHTVLAFDPTDMTGNCVGYNPLEEVRVNTPDEVADVRNIVHQIVDPDGKGLDSHWEKTSFAFLVGVILYTILSRKDRFANLPDVAAILSREEGIQQLYTAMKENRVGPGGTAHPVIERAAIDQLEREPREQGSVLSTAKSFFTLYADPVVARNISRSGFRVADLMNSEHPVSLYLIVSPENKARLRPLIRLMLTQIVRGLTGRLKFEGGQQLKTYKHRLLLMLDEFPTLGRLQIFQDALAHIAGYGMKAYIITQDLTQLRDAYGQNEQITSNCHIRIAYAPNTIETADLLSRMTGKTTVIKRQVSTSGQRAAALLGHVSESLQEHERALLTPDECMTLPGAKKDVSGRVTEPGDMLVFVAGQNPIYGRQILYFRDPTFAKRAKIATPEKSDRLR